MGHTPSTPTVTPPASATDPRYSTSGILNNQIKEKNRQGLLSTFGGRTGKQFDINKFAENKISMRDPSTVPLLEQIAQMYNKAVKAGQAQGVSNSDTSSHEVAVNNMNAYNNEVNKINSVLASYGTTSGLTKAGGLENYDKRQLHGDNFGAVNKDKVGNSLNSAGRSGDIFNQVAEGAKKKLKSTK